MTWLSRLWGVRHVRFWYLSYQVHRWARRWGQMGIGFGVANEADIAELRRIWRGEA